MDVEHIRMRATNKENIWTFNAIFTAYDKSSVVLWLSFIYFIILIIVQSLKFLLVLLNVAIAVKKRLLIRAINIHFAMIVDCRYN